METAMDAPAIETDRLTKTYGRRTAVSAVSLTVRRGEIYGFLGPNGAGKTTTMRMLLGLVRPSSGTARVLGAAAGDPTALRSLGAMIETPSFYPYLSGRDNLRVVARAGSIPVSSVAEVLDQTGMSADADRRVGSYSMGMRQRLGVAAALLGRPELLILDEPTNGLDPKGMAAMRDLLQALRSRGTTIMLSSHQLHDVEVLCDRAGIISHGSLVREAFLDDLRGGVRLAVSAEPLSEARALLERAFGASAVSEKDAKLMLAIDPGLAADVTKRLVTGGIAVHSVARDEGSLEDVLLALDSEVPS